MAGVGQQVAARAWTKRSVAVAAALLWGIVLSPALARAEVAVPPVELWLGTCAGVDADALRRIAALELGSGPRSPDESRPRATIACDGGLATLVVRDDVGAIHRRQVDLGSQPADGRTRLLALVLAEVVESARGRGRLAPVGRPSARVRPATARRVSLRLPPDSADREVSRQLDVAGLRILEQEAGRYGDRSSGYLATVVAIARREHDRRRLRLAELAHEELHLHPEED